MAVDRSGNATTTSAFVALANVNREGMDIQNVGTGNIGVNEFGGAAILGTPGTWTLLPNADMQVRTNLSVSIVAASGSIPFTATEY